MSITATRPLHAFDNDSIRPGPVGSVGDVIGSIKLKHSMPELPLRWDKLRTTVGSNVEDGEHASFTSGGKQARVYDSNWQSGRAFKTSHGWVYMDLRAEDRLHEPFMGSGPQYSWRNTVATNYRAQRTGQMFLPLPGGYNPSPGEIERGQIVPVITSTEAGEELASSKNLVTPPAVSDYSNIVSASRNMQSGFIRPVVGRS